MVCVASPVGLNQPRLKPDALAHALFQLLHLAKTISSGATKNPDDQVLSSWLSLCFGDRGAQGGLVDVH